MEANSTRQKILRQTKAILPWFLCLAIFVYLFNKVPMDEIRFGLTQLHWGAFVLFSFLYFLVILYGDCVGLHYFFKRFVAPVSYSEVVHVRGASFLLSIVNYLLGQAALAYYVKKQYHASLAKALGVVSFVTVMDLLLVFTSGLLGLSATGRYGSSLVLKMAVGLMWLAFAGWAFFWRQLSACNLARLDRFPFFHKIFSHSIFLIFREASLKDYMVLFFTRLPVLLVVLSSVNLAFLAFGAMLPWEAVYLYHPIVLLVSSVPITPAGLGTSQMLMMQFFGDILILPPALAQNVTPVHLVFIASLMWNLANQIFKAAFGGFALYKSKSLRWLENSQNFDK